VKPGKAGKAGKAGRAKPPGAKRPAAAKQGTVPKGVLGAKAGAKRPAVRPGPGAKQSSGPADEPTSGTNGPDNATIPAAQKAGTAPLPDLSAHTDSPTWLSDSHDTELWDGTFDAEVRGAAPAEPSIVPVEDVHLEEPTLQTPSISSDAAEAASLSETAEEVRAVSEEAAEAGKQAGISEPAPEGTEVAVEPGTGLTDLSPSAASEEPDEPDEPEDVPGEKPSGTKSTEEPSKGDEDGAGTDGKEKPSGTADSEPSKTSSEGPAPEKPGDDTAGEPKAAGSRQAAAGPEPAQDENTPKKDEDSTTQAAVPSIQTSTVQSGSTDVAAPVTDSFESLTLTKKDPEDTGLTHTVNPSGSSAVPADSRRARRTREAEEAAARGKGPGRTTRALVLLGSILIVVLLGIWLATVIADSNREEGVLEDSVSPVDLEAGACLQDFKSVNAEVTVVTCETPHNAQLVATQSYAESESFPGTDALAAKAEEVCSSVIYTDAASKYTDLELNRAVPTQSSWDSGDRRVDCFVVAPGEDLTESLIVQP